ncbi:hypothetical protein IC620_02275 [Hazenella sp. IB182357]|uniref:Uncharacterized protein n=1 Tax=Polycladospora coralii TaxID=2771432 RepID=A0A926N960_9BACL|nr:hypothetical protein [Polycladospora coralii]MBD1371185.1 hypothetical protein [Polycladospora coralii]MBS7530127.1 hypothetical protein [Polycladospora coralii]
MVDLAGMWKGENDQSITLIQEKQLSPTESQVIWISRSTIPPIFLNAFCGLYFSDSNTLKGYWIDIPYHSHLIPLRELQLEVDLNVGVLTLIKSTSSYGTKKWIKLSD